MYPKDNLESWPYIHAFINRFPDNAYWSEWKRMVRSIISDLETRGAASLFRIGQGMHQILISTLEHHGLASEPRVTLEFDPEQQSVCVSYSQTLVGEEEYGFARPLAQERVSISKAMPVVLSYLRRLWIETKPNTNLPDMFKAG
jgi:hypothetical protein